jgi:hypothetical protein
VPQDVTKRSLARFAKAQYNSQSRVSVIAAEFAPGRNRLKSVKGTRRAESYTVNEKREWEA